MNADDIAVVTELVAGQLGAFAAEQAAERERLYRIVGGAMNLTSETVRALKGMQEGLDRRMVEFGRAFVDQVVPTIVAALPAAKSPPDAAKRAEAVKRAGDAVQGYVERSFAKRDERLRTLEARVDRAERRVPT